MEERQGILEARPLFIVAPTSPARGVEPTTGFLDLSIVSREIFPFIRNLKVEEPTILSDHKRPWRRMGARDANAAVGTRIDGTPMGGWFPPIDSNPT
jgi:hypothetical protein